MNINLGIVVILGCQPSLYLVPLPRYGLFYSLDDNRVHVITSRTAAMNKKPHLAWCPILQNTKKLQNTLGIIRSYG